MPFNCDDLLLYLTRRQQEFVDLLKISLLIYDETKAIKKFSLSKAFLEEFEGFIRSLHIEKEKLAYINEKLLLFLTSL